MRLAIGAGRARLVRQLLTEAVLLFALGGATGLLLARGMISVVTSLLPDFPFVDHEDTVGVLDGGKSVRNDQRRALFEQLVKSILDQ